MRVAVVTCVLGVVGSGCRSNGTAAKKSPATAAPLPTVLDDTPSKGAPGLAGQPSPAASATTAPTALANGYVGGGGLGLSRDQDTGGASGTLGHGAPSPRPAQHSAGTFRGIPLPGDPLALQPPPAPGTQGAPPGLVGATGAPAAQVDKSSAAPAKLDANARYATTYRPGGAALAAFDAAVARGQIPSSYKDLVGAFGDRYAPALAAPTDSALSVAIETERTAVGPTGGPVNLRVSLASSDSMATRAPLSVHLVLDTSGSMSGQAIEDARKAAEAVVAKLAHDDDFSMVTFSDTAHVLVADGPIGPRRADVVARIEKVQADGGTNISSGLDEAYAEAHDAHIAPDAVRIVMLLSDGHANGGDTSPDHLASRAARAFQDGIQTSSFGLGPDFDASLMSRIADRGAGGYYYIADTSQIAPALTREIDARLQPVATAVELRVRLRPDISAIKVFGSHALSGIEAQAVRAQEVSVDAQEQQKGIRRDRQTDAEGGMRFFIPAFARADRHSTMLTLDLPPGVGERNIASVELRYKDRLLRKNVTKELPVKMRWADSDAESAKTEDPSVERMAQAFEAGETILAAAERVDAGDRAGAGRLIDERVDLLRRAAEALQEPMLAEDGARLARLGAAIGRDGGISDPLPLVVMLRGTGYGYL
jgi:Ca-activated chloride channel family protein